MDPARSKTLEELTGNRWGKPSFASSVVTTCHTLRRKPLCDLTDEEVRLAIGQKVDVTILVPLALERLKLNPTASGDFYEGALLQVVLLAAHESRLTPHQRECLEEIIEEFWQTASLMDEAWRECCQPALDEALADYRLKP